MADTCAHCGPIGTFVGEPGHNLKCPDHGLVVTSLRAVAEHDLTNAVFGSCTQHPTAPVVAGICRTCAEDTINAAIIKPFTMTVEGPLSTEAVFTFEKLTAAINATLPPLPRRHPNTERRNRYGAAIRDYLKAVTVPSAIPGGPPALGATEYDIADATLAVRDDELAQLVAERNAALRLVEVWDDAPDPACRAMAADLRSAIKGARAARRLSCGWCYQENGEEVHPHPECPIGRTPVDNGATIPAALTAPTPEERARQLAEQTANTICGDTTTGGFGNTLGPCINQPHHETQYHRDARGAEWAYHGTPTHRTELGRRITDAIQQYDNRDNPNGLAAIIWPTKHQRGQAAAVLDAIEEFLDLGDAEAWCKSCRRVWENRDHRCESDAEQQLDALRDDNADLVAHLEHYVRTLAALKRFNQLTADSCRVHAAEHARDNLDLIDTHVKVPVHVAAGSARAEFLNLCAQWGLRTNHGSREIVARILQLHAHEVAEDLRAWVRNGDAGAPEYGSTENVLEGADRIDPHSPHYAGAQH